MPYDSPIFLEMIQPMREELTRIGFEELRTANAVREAIENRPGTMMVVVNSICGCAAGIARPAVAQALEQSKKPDHLVTVFAGQDVDATRQARSYFTGYPPSSPSVALLKDGKLVSMVERRQIEGHTIEEVARLLTEALQSLPQ